MRSLPFLHLRGDHYHLGLQMGEQLRPQIKESLRILQRLAKTFPQYDLAHFITLARAYVPYARRAFPHLYREFEGIVAGSGQDHDLVWLLNVEEILFDEYFTKCTSFVLKEKDNSLTLYHNEDFDAGFQNNTAVVHATLPNKTSFISLCFPGMLPGSSVSVNSSGLIQAINSLDPVDTRIGIPKNFIARAVLEAHTIPQAIGIIRQQQRASAYNHILLQGNTGVSVETTARAFKILPLRQFPFVHTNHYLHTFKNKWPLPGSRKRYHTVTRFLGSSPADPWTVLSAHTPYAICHHPRPGLMQATVASLRINSVARALAITPGNPCRTQPKNYSLVLQ